jgi:hypothetical protein
MGAKGACFANRSSHLQGKHMLKRTCVSVMLQSAIAMCAVSQATAQSVDPTHAPGSPIATATPTTLGVVVVKGTQPGPGLWKVSNDNHVMWVLGIASPLPANIAWKTQEVQIRLSHSQEELEPPGVVAGARVGFFGKLFLLPSLIGIRNNPDGQTLRDVLPAPVYQRWEAARSRYGLGEGTDRLRPMFAGKALYAAAIKRAGLSEDGGAQAIVDAIAKQHTIKQTPTQYIAIIDDPHKAARTFKATSMEDVGCLSHVLDMLDGDLSQTKTRANAWATGNLPKLQALAGTEAKDACLSAVSGASFAQKLGVVDLQQRIDNTWMAAAKKALADNDQTFALLPMDQVLSSTGYLAELKSAGFTVTSPYDIDDGAGTAQATAP